MFTGDAASTTPLTDEPVLTENARKVLEARYLKKNERGECIETPGQLFRRVAKTIADVELQYGGTELDRRHWEDRFYKIMTSGAFMPNSPTLMNAGREMGMLSACFVLPVRDSIVDIFNSIKHTALIQKAGGGTGFAFDELRPTGDYIRSSGGTTSGPISFWRAFSEATNAIQQGAFRRGANMGMMYIHHPDILKFLHAKQDLTQFTNYNISVKVTDDWMEEFLADPDTPHVVRNPRTGQAFVIPRDVEIWMYDIRDLVPVDCVEPVNPAGRERYYRTPRLTGSLSAEWQGRVYTKRDIWTIIIRNAWQTGEPGVVFIDRINEDNPTPHLGRIEATNPCGEQPLLPYEACNLGSLNLGLFVRDECRPTANVDWDALREAVHVATRFLDNVIDANNYPLPEIEQLCRANRKIGLGIMGFADALFKLGVPYNSEDGIAWAERFMKFVSEEAHACSERLARERGCFANWQGSVWHTRHNRVMRNAAVTTVAPTGTISIIANCSGGIEPLFALAFLRNVLKGQRPGDRPLVEVNEVFLRVARERGFYSEELIEQLLHDGTLAHIPQVPEDVKRVFVCAHDISAEWHIRMQAAFQRHCDASISKTINFPNTATPEDVEHIYLQAYRLRCKGITVYRDGCRSEQPMALKRKNGAEVAGTGQGQSHEDSSGNGHAEARSEPCTECDPRAMSNDAARPIEPMDLPEIVSGFRIRQMTPFGNMHVKITVDPRADRELEVFAQLGKGGDVANSDLEAICRMISLWLRAGGSLRHVIKQLEGIGTSLQIPTRNGRIMSLGDGLACALKKYTKAKERFGLRALLLGEADLAELDQPNTPPHGPQTAPLDRPVRPVGEAKIDQALRGEVPDVSVAVQPRVTGSRSIAPPTRGQTPRAVHAGGNGNGNGNGSGNGHGQDEVVVATAVAVAEPEDELVVEVSDAARSVVDDTADEAVTVAERRAQLAADLKTVLGEVRHRHDSALFYKVLCPECGEPLLRQEGCRRCPACGWAAC
jgi:ribonucleoside-diphosphate reductase alpha chain